MGGKRAAILAIVMLAAPAAFGEVNIPPTRAVVVDLANIIDDNVEQQLSALLEELRDKTTAEVKVVTVGGTDGEPFSEWTQHLYDTWKLGVKGKDNGAILAIAVDDRNVRIATGYGLEHVLPDSWCGTECRAVARDYFKSGVYSDGLAKLTVTIANRIAQEQGVTLSSTQGILGQIRPVSNRQSGTRKEVPAGGCCAGAFPFLIMLIVLTSLRQRSRHYSRWGGGGMWQGIVLGSLLGDLSRGGGSSWGGGGSGGGGFGGGGFFGGGGMSGGGGGGASW